VPDRIQCVGLSLIVRIWIASLFFELARFWSQMCI